MDTELSTKSLATWYKYNRLLGIRRPKVKKRNRKTEGLRATQTNQYWHLDVTIFKTLDGVKHYIHILMDNFSRKVLAWRLADKLSAQGTVEVLEAAIGAIENQLHQLTPSLIVDRGSENNAELVQETLGNHTPPIQKLIAQSDILQSNSMVEAINKNLKYNYLYRQPIEDGEKLRPLIEKAIHDYNELRPHGLPIPIGINGLTPAEVYSGMTLKDLKTSEKLEQARKNRVERNRKSNCKGCK